MNRKTTRVKANTPFSHPLTTTKSSIAIAISTALFASNAFSATTGSLADSSVDSNGGATISGVGDGSKTASVDTVTQNTIIDWSTLGLASDETINFNGGVVDSVILNRVVGNDASLMDGAVNSSNVETLIFVNPNGITVGSNFNNTGALNSNLMISTKDIADLTGYDSDDSDGIDENFGLTLTDSGNNADITINAIRATVNDDKLLNIVSEGNVTITNSGSGTDTLGANYLTITADGNVDGSAGAIAADGEISISAAGLDGTDGDVDIESVKAGVIYIDAAGDVSVSQSESTLTIGQIEGANIDLTSVQSLAGGAVIVNNPITATTGSQSGKNTDFSDADAHLISDGTITITASDSATNNLEIGSSGNLIQVSSAGGTLTTSGTKVGNLYLELDGSLNLGDVTAAENIQITGVNDSDQITQTGTLTLSKSAGGEIELDFEGADVTNLDVTVSNSNDLSITANDLTSATIDDTNVADLTISADDISAATIANTDDISITSDSLGLASGISATGQTITLSVDGAISGATGTDFTADTLVINGSNSSGTFETDVNNLNLTSAGSLDVTNDGNLVLGVATVNGDTSISAANAGDDITIGNSMTIASGASLSLDTSGAGEIIINGAVSGDSASAGTLNLVADNMDINSAIDTGVVTIDSATADANIDLGGATGTLNLDSTSLSNLTAGTNEQNVQISDAANTGTVTISSSINNANVNLDINSSALNIDSAVTAKTLDIDSTSTVTTTATVSADDISVVASGDVTLLTDVDTIDIDAGTGNISITETDALTLNDITTTSTATNAIVISSAALTSNASTSIETGAGGQIGLTTTGDVDINVTGGATFNALSDGVALAIDAGSNSLTFTDAVGDDNADDTLTVTSLDIQSATDISTGADAITVTAGDLDLSATGTLTVAGALSATGDVTLSGNTVSLAAVTSDSDTSGAGDITIEAGTGDLALSGTLTTNNNDIDIRGLSDSDTLGLGSGTGDVNISQAELDLIQAGTGVITFGKATGGAVDIDAVDLDTTTTHSGVDILSAGAIAIDNALNIGAGGDNDLDLQGASISNGGSAVITANELDIVTTGNAVLSGSNALDGTLTANIGGDLTVTNTAGLDLGAVTTTSFTLTTNGAVTDSGTVIATGTTTIDSMGNDITLDSAANDFETINLDGANVTVVDVDSIDLGTTDATGNLSITAAGDVTDSGVITVTGTTSVTNANADVILDGDSNSFTGAVTVTDNSGSEGTVDVTLDNGSTDLDLTVNSVGDVTVESAGALGLGGFAAGDFTATSSTSMSNIASLRIDGRADLNSTGDIVLTNTGNNFNIVDASTSGDVTLVDEREFILGDITATNLTATSNVDNVGTGESLTQDAGTTINVTGTTTVATGTNGSNDAELTLNEAGNDFGTLIVSRGSDVTINDVDDVVIGGVTASGDLDITAGGAVTDSGTITVTGDTSVMATGFDITLADASSDFGTIDLDGTNVSIVDVDDVDLGVVTATGTLDVTAGGAVTDSGTVDVTGATTVTATGFDISLNTVDNNFDSVMLDGANITVVDEDALDIGMTTASALTITASGDVTDTDVITVSGTTTIDTSGANGDIDLSTNTQVLNTLVVNAGTGDVDVDETDALTLEVTAAADVTIDSVGALTLNAGSMDNLTVSAADSVADAGALLIVNTASIDTSVAGGNIDLANTADSHLITTLVANAGVGTVDVDTNAALFLGNITASALTADVNNGGLTSTGTLTVSGLTDIDTSHSNGGIALNNTAHSLSSLQVNAGTGNVDINEADALTLAVTAAGDVTLDSVGALTLNAGSMANLTVTTSASITDAGALTITDTANLTTSNGVVDLDNNTHSLTNLLVNAGTGVIDIAETDNLNLGTTTGSALTITAGGDVTDTGVVTVSGTTSINTSGASGDIDLSNNAQVLNTLVVNAGTGDVYVNETDALTLEVTAAGDVTVDSVGALTLNAGSMADLTVTAASSVTDAGALTSTGTVSIDTSAANGNIDLDNNVHTLANFGGNAGTGTIDILELNDLNLGTTTASALTIISAGAITDTGVITVSGTTTLDTSTGNGNVVLDDAANSFAGSVAVNAGTGDVTLVDSTALELGATTANMLTVTSGGDLTDSATVTVNTLDFDSTGGVTLDAIDVSTINDSAAQGSVAITTTANSGDTLTVNDIIITDSTPVNTNESDYSVSITETQGSAETGITLAGDIKATDGASDLYLSSVSVSAGSSNEREIDSDGNALLKAKAFTFTAHGNLGRTNPIDIDWKDSTASSVNRLTVSLGDLDAVDIDNDTNHSNNNSDFDDVSLNINIAGFDLEDEDNLQGGSREIAISFTTENSSDTSAGPDLIDATNDTLSGNFLELNYFNRNTFTSVNNRIDQLEELLGEGFDSDNGQTVAAYISYLVNGDDGINGFVDIDGDLVTAGINASDFFDGTGGSFTTITKLGNQIASIADFFDSADATATAADGSDVSYATLKSSVRAGDLNSDSTSDTLANEIAAIQTDIDNNETASDSADTALDNRVTEVEGTLTGYTSASTVAAAVTANATAISDETTRATAAELANATAISDETTRATAAEMANATAISDETTRATTAETANATKLAALAAFTMDTDGNITSTTINNDVNVTAGGTGASLSNAIADVTANATEIASVKNTANIANAKADAIADFRVGEGDTAATTVEEVNNSNVVLKAVDATAATVGDETLGQLGNDVQDIEDDKNTGNGFLDFFRKLFGNSEQ
ncbi:filamentous hemagglutinin N-terminal domain-containing protein [Catenovulum maritimum]|uniref:Filamentous haemagglutinin FhaB/tRNA nuclease CdiA-like TPS domain-containing protein n=1 Tax=Catenovulum maritimum TaxID=1513271 RepID=A0A0J8JN81_9ALTE|nr:filamentous hemagglutinin N-terminal domain-containing protein [Catenovulum maritimum]KMT66061.1 hypothetical protein XM47_06340 [Catenovulum maritimum]